MYKQLYKFNLNYLLKIRLDIGHHYKNRSHNLNPYLLGTKENIDIFDFHKQLMSLKHFYFNISDIFSKRNSFFIIGTNNNDIPMIQLLNRYLLRYSKKDKFSSFYISGYVDLKWIEGLFSNWKIFNEFLTFISQPVEVRRKTKIKYKFLRRMEWFQGLFNLIKIPIPDFVIFLDKDDIALNELKKLQIPLIGIVDTDMNPDDFIYKIFGNNNSIENIEFFFSFFREAAQVGRYKEQQLFLYYLILNIKKKIHGKKY